MTKLLTVSASSYAPSRQCFYSTRPLPPSSSNIQRHPQPHPTFSNHHPTPRTNQQISKKSLKTNSIAITLVFPTSFLSNGYTTNISPQNQTCPQPPITGTNTPDTTTTPTRNLSQKKQHPSQCTLSNRDNTSKITHLTAFAISPATTYAAKMMHPIQPNTPPSVNDHMRNPIRISTPSKINTMQADPRNRLTVYNKKGRDSTRSTCSHDV